MNISFHRVTIIDEALIAIRSIHMNIIAWIILGGIAGAIASFITGTNRGIVGDILVGIIGAFIGGWVVTLFGGEPVTGFNVPSLLVAVLGSIILIWIAHVVRRDTSVQP